MKKLEIALVIVLGLLSPIIAFSVNNFGYDVGRLIGYWSAKKEVHTPDLEGTDI